jgi:hypothetical protein
MFWTPTTNESSRRPGESHAAIVIEAGWASGRHGPVCGFMGWPRLDSKNEGRGWTSH